MTRFFNLHMLPTGTVNTGYEEVKMVTRESGFQRSKKYRASRGVLQKEATCTVLVENSVSYIGYELGGYRCSLIVRLIWGLVSPHIKGSD
jgi:hypothetical protein